MSRILVGSRRATPPPASTSAQQQHGSEDSGEEECNCPLCIQTMDASDCRFKPCPCGYQICRFCWHRIREEGNERCPACRRIYTDEDVEFLPPGEEKPRKKKGSGRVATSSSSLATPFAPAAATPATPAGVLPSRRHLVDIRVIQKNLVYVIGISARIAHEPILSEPQYFGQFGKILKIVVNRKNTGAPLPAEKMAAGSGAATTTSGSAYVTYARAEEAGRAIAYVDGSVFDGRVLRATYGTTKYCSYFLRGINCPNAGCMYLHEEGVTSDSYTKEELSSGKMHLHSSLVDRTEGAALRQFGTLMFRPAPPPPARVVSPPPANVATVIINHEQLGQDLVRPASAPPRGSAANEAPPVPDQESPRSPPINLAQCEDDAMTFLSRLSRWNASSDILDQAGGASAAASRPHSALASTSLSSASTTAGASYFDPFAEAKPASPKISSTWLASLALRPPPAAAAEAAPTNRALPTLSAKGPLLGFDWSPVLQNRDDLAAPSSGGGGKGYFPPSVPPRSASSPIVTFRHHVGNFSEGSMMAPPPPAQPTWASPAAANKPAPVGSPAGFAPMVTANGGFQPTLQSAVAPTVTAAPFRSTGTHPHLEQLFASGPLGPPAHQPPIVSSSSLHPPAMATMEGGGGGGGTGTRRVLDASQLEQQFFRQAQPPLNVSLAANEILSASPVMATTRSARDQQQQQHHHQSVAATVAAHGVDPLLSATTVATAASSSYSSSSSSIKVLGGGEGVQPQLVPGEGFRVTTTIAATKNNNNGGKSAKIITKPIVVPPPSEPEAGLTVSSGTGPQAAGKKKVAPPPPVALARIKELALAKEIAAASVKPPREKSTAGSPSVKAVAPTVIAEGGGSGAEGANGGRASKLPHQASELDPQTVVALSTDNGRSRDQQEALVTAVSSQAEESASSEGTGVLSASASKRRVKSRKEAAVVAAAPTAVTLPARQPAPVLATQPDYLPAWPETANGYAPSPIPNYSTMTEAERTSWRQWLQDECKTSKAEEALLRAKVSKIHAEICNWINNYAHSI